MAEVFVTGVTGFLGRHLCATLLEWGANVTALVRKPPRGRVAPLPDGVEIRVGDLKSVGTRTIPPDTDMVFHLGARTSARGSIADPVRAFDINARSTARLLEEVRRRELKLSRFVLASSSLVYALSPGRRVSEQSAVQPASPYGASKAAAETHAFAYDALYDIPVTAVRVFNAYGPHQSPGFVVQSMLSQCLASGNLRLGNLWPIRDFVYATDVVDLFWKAGTSPRGRGEVFNAGTGRGTSIKELAAACQKLTGFTGRAKVEPGRSHAQETSFLVADVSKAKRLLGWSATTKLSAGLKQTADWMARPVA